MLSALAFTLLFASCKRGEPVELKLNLQSGSQYLYTIDTKMTTEQSAMGQTLKTTNNMLMESTYDVKDADNGNKAITVTYDRLAMSLQNALVQMKYDSRDSNASDPALKHLSKMLNRHFTMQVTPQGEVLKVEGLGEIINSMDDSARMMLGQTFNDSAIRSMMQQSLNIFPDKPVRPGDTWKKTYQYDMSIMGMKIENEFKLASVANGTAKIDVKSKITGGGTMGDEQMKGMQMELGGEQKGTLDVEVATGLITDGKLEQDVKGTISMMNMKVPITMQQQVHITAKKK